MGGRIQYTEEFKLWAVAQVTDKGHSVTCSTTSNYSTIQNAGMLTMGACHTSNSRWQQNEVARCLYS